jgi:hypothetical protein
LGLHEDLQWLRDEWKRLKQQDEALQTEHRKLQNTTDRVAAHEHAERLRVYRLDLETFHKAVIRFHDRYGAFGN